MNQLFAIIGNIFQRYSMGQRLVIVTILIGMLSSFVALVMWANRPEYDVLYSDINPSSAGNIVSQLRDMKVKYIVENNGRTILVPSNYKSELQLQFAGEGYASEVVKGYEIFDNTNIGMTTFMQKLNMRRALEGELIKTINQFSGVKNSRVHLVLPEGRIFEKDKSGSASVVIYPHAGSYLGRDQVKGISSMVANSVEGIKPEDVTIVDSDGNLLTSAQSENNSMGSTGNQWEMTHTIESNTRNKVMDILEGVLGYQNALVEVSVDLDFQQIERTTESFDPENVVIVSEERQSGSSTSIDTSLGSTEKNENESVVTNYELNKTVEHYINHAGTIKRLSVAVLVNGKYTESKDENGETVSTYVPRSSKELTQIAALVQSAVGYNQDRGDIVEVQNLQFDKSIYESDNEYFLESEKQIMWANVIDKGLIGFGVLIAFFLLKTIIKNAGPTLQLARGPSPTYVGGKPTAQYQLSEEEEEIPEDIYIAKLSPEARAKLKAKDKMTKDVVTYAKDKPEDAAKLIRSWLTKPQ